MLSEMLQRNWKNCEFMKISFFYHLPDEHKIFVIFLGLYSGPKFYLEWIAHECLAIWARILTLDSLFPQTTCIFCNFFNT